MVFLRLAILKILSILSKKNCPGFGRGGVHSLM